jgi:hypothetical protein
MSSADCLSRYGLAPVEEIGYLESQFPGLSMDEAYECDELRFDEVADDHARFKGCADARAYQAALTEHIRAHGIANAIGLGPAYEAGRFEAGVVNGQHRYFAARDLGLTHIPAGPNRIAPCRWSGAGITHLTSRRADRSARPERQGQAKGRRR